MLKTFFKKISDGKTSITAVESLRSESFIGQQGSATVENIGDMDRAVGLLPGIGIFADVINSGLYFTEGDLVNGLVSMGAALPVVGNAVTGSKVVVKGAKAAKGSTSAARLSSNGAKLNQHLTQLEKYGSGGFKTLQNGRFRYYGKATLNRGDANSFRMVREWNPATGGKRTWFETLNPNGGVIQVRPEFGTGVKTHYLFNGSGGYLGKW